MNNETDKSNSRHELILPNAQKLVTNEDANITRNRQQCITTARSSTDKDTIPNIVAKYNKETSMTSSTNPHSN
jgi:hypothetical protein